MTVRDKKPQLAAELARSGATDGISTGCSSHRSLLLLQRSAGNGAVTQMVTSARPAPAFVQRVNMPEALPDDITRVLTDSQPPNNTDAKMTAAILTKISSANASGKAGEKVTARNDPRIIQRMTAALSRANTLKIMRALGASLSQRMPLATGAAFAAATTLAIVKGEIAASPATQRQQLLKEPSAVNGIQTALSRPDSLKAMVALGAALREILDAAMRGAGAESAAMVSAVATAPAGQKKEVLEDGALMTLMRDRLARGGRLKILSSLGAPVVDQLNATVDGAAATDPAAAVKVAKSVPAAARELVRADRELMARLQAALNAIQMRDVLIALHASLADILGLVLGTPAGGEADIVKAIGAADAAQRQAALDDAALLARIKAAFAVASYWRLRLLLAFGTQAKVDASSAQIPALSNGAAHRSQAHIDGGEQADAVRTVVDSLVARHKINPATYKDITYDSAVAADARASFPGFAADATTKKFAPTDKATIKVGSGGVVNASVLTASIVRECARAVREAAPATVDPTSADAVKVSAVETALYEIEHRAESGIARYGARMAELGARLDAAYTALDAKGQKKVKTRYDRAKAAVATVPAGAAPVATQSLTALVSTELAKAPPGGAAIKTAIAAAPAADKKPVLQNHDLVNRVVALLSRPDALTVLTQLGAPLSQRVEYLRQAGAPQAEIATAISGATAADRRSVSQNRALTDSVVANLGDAQVAGVISDLGGSLTDELDRALRAATPLTAVTTAIGAAGDSAAQFGS